MLRRATLIFIWTLLTGGALAAAAAEERILPFKKGDVVAFIGGGDVAAMRHGGHLEALLTAAYPALGLRFRNLAWEGDTVFQQPRDVKFPDLKEHLEKLAATVVIAEFGRAEALDRNAPSADEFAAAYEKLLMNAVPRDAAVALVTPPPFENGGGLLPKLTPRNAELAARAEAIRALASKHDWPLIDLFSALPKDAAEPGLTTDGLQLSARGQAILALAFADRMGLSHVVQQAGGAMNSGAWKNPKYERMRQAIVQKNQDWFNYWRTENWAFLGGDRTEQPSSRDYRDPSIRWFPVEIEEFNGLIAAKEAGIAKLASELNP
jgi:hypothetical protein